MPANHWLQFGACLLLVFCGPLHGSQRPNVLLIAIDDLNDWVGCLGGHPDARSPHIDRLASRGVLFSNAHCQAPLCNPSRTSILYGVRPTTSGVMTNKGDCWQAPALRNHTTLPRHLAANGYRTLATGKIYHDSGMPPGDFEVPGPTPGQRIAEDKRLIQETPGGARGLWDFGPQDYDESHFQDHRDASWAIERIKESSGRPFFLAVGFYRPHVPLYAPRRVFEQIPLAEIDLPVVRPDDRADIPPVVAGLIQSRYSPDHDWFVRTDHWRLAVQSYLACVRWTDEQVGRLLEALDQSPHADNTIVILYSDHGFLLGEKDHWAKQCLWERATRVPLIIAAPGHSKGAVCRQPAELLSIYPTLLELCSLPPNPQLEGTSLVPLLIHPDATWDKPALTTHGKGNHALRTATHRYIRYHDGSEELYDLRNDPNEWTNLALDPAFTAMKAELARQLPRDERPPYPPPATSAR